VLLKEWIKSKDYEQRIYRTLIEDAVANINPNLHIQNAALQRHLNLLDHYLQIQKGTLNQITQNLSNFES